MINQGHVATTPLDRADPDVLLKTVRDGALTGAVGIASGFAIFIMIWEQDLSVLKFLVILLMVALFTWGFEYIRDVIDGNEHHFRAPQIIARLFLVATFELFALALHAVLTSDWRTLFQEIGTAVLGVTLAKEVGAIWNMITIALLWVSVGAALGGGLAWAIGGAWVGPRSAEQDRAIKGTGPLVGLLMGAVAAPLLVFAYVVGARLIVEFGWMLSKPGQWVATLNGLNDRIPLNFWTFGLKLIIWSMSQIGLMFSNSALGPILATLILLALMILTMSQRKEDRNAFATYSLLAAPVVVFGAPLVGPSIYRDIKNLGILLLLVAVVWGTPGLLLGTALPYLRRPSENPKTWAFVAWVAAAFLIAFMMLIQVKWTLLLATLLVGFAALLVGTGVFFWRGAPVGDYWPLIALCVAIVVLGVTQIAQRANFFHIQELSRALISQPLATVAVPGKPVNPFAYLMPKPPDLSLPQINPECEKYLSLLDRLNCLQKQPTLAQKLRDLRGWLTAVSAEEESSLKLVAIARQSAAALREQAARDEALAAASAGRVRTLMREIAAAQSETRSLLIGSRDLRESISSELSRLTDLSQRRPYARLGSLVDQGLPVSLDTEVTLAVSHLAATIQSLTDRKVETDEALHTLETANGHLEPRLTKLKDKLAQQFELCLNGSLGFWITLGLLAGWSRHNREAGSPSSVR